MQAIIVNRELQRISNVLRDSGRETNLDCCGPAVVFIVIIRRRLDNAIFCAEKTKAHVYEDSLVVVEDLCILIC